MLKFACETLYSVVLLITVDIHSKQGQEGELHWPYHICSLWDCHFRPPKVTGWRNSRLTQAVIGGWRAKTQGKHALPSHVCPYCLRVNRIMWLSCVLIFIISLLLGQLLGVSMTESLQLYSPQAPGLILRLPTMLKVPSEQCFHGLCL